MREMLLFAAVPQQIPDEVTFCLRWYTSEVHFESSYYNVIAIGRISQYMSNIYESGIHVVDCAENCQIKF